MRRPTPEVDDRSALNFQFVVIFSNRHAVFDRSDDCTAGEEKKTVARFDLGPKLTTTIMALVDSALGKRQYFDR